MYLHSTKIESLQGFTACVSAADFCQYAAAAYRVEAPTRTEIMWWSGLTPAVRAEKVMAGKVFQPNKLAVVLQNLYFLSVLDTTCAA